MGRSRRFRGVRQRHWGSWVSEIRHPLLKTRIWLGTYESAEYAAKAYDEAARLMSGSKAKTNFAFDPKASSLLAPSLITKLHRCHLIPAKALAVHTPCKPHVTTPSTMLDILPGPYAGYPRAWHNSLPLSNDSNPKLGKKQSITCLRLDAEKSNLGLWQKKAGKEYSKSTWVMTLKLDDDDNVDGGGDGSDGSKGIASARGEEAMSNIGCVTSNNPRSTCLSQDRPVSRLPLVGSEGMFAKQGCATSGNPRSPCFSQDCPVSGLPLVANEDVVSAANATAPAAETGQCDVSPVTVSIATAKAGNATSSNLGRPVPQPLVAASIAMAPGIDAAESGILDDVANKSTHLGEPLPSVSSSDSRGHHVLAHNGHHRDDPNNVSCTLMQHDPPLLSMYDSISSQQEQLLQGFPVPMSLGTVAITSRDQKQLGNGFPVPMPLGMVTSTEARNNVSGITGQCQGSAEDAIDCCVGDEGETIIMLTDSSTSTSTSSCTGYDAGDGPSILEHQWNLEDDKEAVKSFEGHVSYGIRMDRHLAATVSHSSDVNRQMQMALHCSHGHGLPPLSSSSSMDLCSEDRETSSQGQISSTYTPTFSPPYPAPSILFEPLEDQYNGELGLLFEPQPQYWHVNDSQYLF